MLLRLAVIFLFLPLLNLLAQAPAITVTELSPTLLALDTTDGNVIASVGPDGAFLVGTPPAASTPQISNILTTRTKNPSRYVVIFPREPAHSEGDAGWGRLGAFVAMHENALRRLGGNNMGAPTPMAHQFRAVGVERPRIAFSEVLAFNVNGDSIHVVHQAPGYSNADAIVHFHTGNLVYLGEVFPGDGYPSFDAAQGGTLAGLLKTLDAWAGGSIRVMPARGKVSNGAGVKEFRDMIVTVRDRVKQMIAAGQTESQIVAQHPTAEFDAQWGHGRVSPDDFVRALYNALKTS
jgi:hypothetical protein